ncbi:hypothetical protein [Bacillus sp. BP-3]|uniref:hypothetical protein n=1 Tax=Bacillus sp. BP-3 TaxID=3022773 RepID=UPI0023301C12|nr:hypothetical protein [Bacillus sp. BP-3]MDC2867576.1 hypothetical protein [Bacillus sp. BP-3]
MKILTNKQLEELLLEAEGEGFDKGYNRGYEEGHRKGMTHDKKGIVMTSSGIYHFEDGNFKVCSVKE